METMPSLSLRYIPLWVEDVSRRTIVQIITKYKVSREMGLCRVIIMEGRKQTGPKEGHKPVVCVEGLFWIVKALGFYLAGMRVFQWQPANNVYLSSKLIPFKCRHCYNSIYTHHQQQRTNRCRNRATISELSICGYLSRFQQKNV